METGVTNAIDVVTTAILKKIVNSLVPLLVVEGQAEEAEKDPEDVIHAIKVVALKIKGVTLGIDQLPP